MSSSLPGGGELFYNINKTVGRGEKVNGVMVRVP